MAGSQEITTHQIQLPGGMLTLIEETYLGITVEGAEALVAEFVQQLD